MMYSDLFESGGGSTTNLDLDKFGPALRWMTYEAILAGLDMDPLRGEWEKLIEPHNSMTVFWRIVECLPIKRLTYKGRDKKGREKTTHWCISFAIIVDGRATYSPFCMIRVPSLNDVCVTQASYLCTSCDQGWPKDT